MTIRSATIADAQALTAIYTYYVENTPITFETEVPSVQEFAERIAKTLKRYPYLVAEEAGEIVGYAYASAYKERAAYDWTVEVTVYLAPDAKAKGLGTALYQVADFAQVGYKFNQWHDVIWMQKELQWFPEKVPAFIPNEKA